MISSIKMARLGFASAFCEVLGAKRAGIPEPIFLSLKEKWRGWDLNPEPMAYESTAPPLSYLAERTLILTETRKKVNQNFRKISTGLSQISIKLWIQI